MKPQEPSGDGVRAVGTGRLELLSIRGDIAFSLLECATYVDVVELEVVS